MDSFDVAVVKPAAAIGGLLAVFFVAGVAVGSMTVPSSDSVTPSEESSVSQDAALEKARRTLEAGPFSYPFTYNLSTVSVNRHRFGGTYFYNWTISYVVEPNPFQSPLYSVPPNESQVTKTLTLYVSRDGDYFFQSPPISTAGQQAG